MGKKKKIQIKVKNPMQGIASSVKKAADDFHTKRMEGRQQRYDQKLNKIALRQGGKTDRKSAKYQSRVDKAAAKWDAKAEIGTSKWDAAAQGGFNPNEGWAQLGSQAIDTVGNILSNQQISNADSDERADMIKDNTIAHSATSGSGMGMIALILAALLLLPKLFKGRKRGK